MESISQDQSPSPQEQPSIQLTVQIDVGNVIDPSSGRSVRLQGEIPCILPKFAYKHPNSIEIFNIDFSWLPTWLKEARFIRYDESDMEEILEKVQDSITSCFFIMPDVEPNSEPMKLLIRFLVVSLLLDDMVETKDFFGSSTKRASEYSKMMLDILLGKVKKIENLPKTYPVLQPFLKSGFVFSELANETIPEFRNNCIHFAKYCSHALEAQQLLQAEFGGRKKLQPFTNESLNGGTEKELISAADNLGLGESTFEYLRALDSGICIVIELIALLQSISLPDNIRESLYFKHMMSLANSIGRDVNDFIGIGRDLDHTTSSFNCILYRMKVHQLDLQTSCEITLKGLKKEIAEFNIICHKLREQHQSNSRLEAFINIVEKYLDGAIYWYIQTTKRYKIEKATIIEHHGKDSGEYSIEQLTNSLKINFKLN